ncbi:MAG: T9SS type A sorting domain-containing protein [Bacteroidetes bacterium]|nr:T9SS type A sorting domain-containing protein [Bacteroidota bacterium]
MKKQNNFKTILPDRKPERGIKMTVLMALLTLSSFWGVAQTVLISPTGNGGFESATSTFAANGWTVVNAANGNSWVVGSTTFSAGTKGAYISSNGGGNNNYTNGGFPSATRIVHFYRDVTFPAGQTQITLSFKWKGDGESNNDDLKVFLAATSVTPASGSEVASGNLIGGGYENQTSYQTVTITIPAANAGTTKRLIFSWRNNNNFGGSNPAGSFDEISLTTCTPPSITASSNTPVCVGSSLNLTAVGSGSFSWAGPNSFTSSTQNPTVSNVTAAAAGTYTVTVTSGGCSASATTSVSINPAATGVAPTASAASVCAGTNFNLSANIGVAAALANTADFAIPDNNTTGISSPITISNGFLASQVASVTININHGYTGDMDIFLKAPNGSQIELSTDNGAGGNNYTNTVFVTGAASITTGAAPFTGNFAPEQAFSTLTGSANGIWNLVVKDDAGSDVGTLLDWTLSVISSTGVTYTWSSVPAGFSSSAPQPTTSLSAATTYSVSSTFAGCSNSIGSAAVGVLAAPTVEPTSNSPVCEDADIALSGSSGVSYAWSGPNGFTSNVQNPVISAAALNAGGTYTQTVTNAFGCSASNTTVVVVNDRPTLSIGSIVDVTCNGGNNGSFQMNVVGGTGPFNYSEGLNLNVDGAFTGYVAGTVTVLVSDNVGCEDTEDVTVTEPGPISIADAGTNQLHCNIGTSSLLANTPVVGVGSWSVVSGTANITDPSSASSGLTGLGTGSIVLRWTITQVGCSSNFDDVTIINSPSAPSIPGVISGVQVACPPLTGEVFSIAPVANALSYLWYVGPTSNGVTFTSPVDGLSVTADFGATINSGYGIRVHAINGCGAGDYSAIFLRRTVSTPLLTGSTQACANDVKTYTIPAAIGGAVSYTWTGPAGTTFNGNAGPFTSNTLAVNAQFSNVFVSGNVCVVANSPCGIATPQRCIAVSSIPARPVSVSGLLKACPGSSLQYNVATVAGATSYNWSLPAGATISSGLGTATVTIDFSAGFNGGNICVTATNACTTGASRCINVQKATPTMPGNMVGPIGGLCGGTYTYSVPSEPGILSYNWTVPAGAVILNGAGSNSVEVDFSGVAFPSAANQYLQMAVTKTNSCSTGPARTITVKGVPSNAAAITGANSVCAEDASLAYSVPLVFGATNYVWSVPSGGNIISGQGTNSVVIDWGFFSGVIGVTATNSCGNGGTRTLLVNVTCRLASTASSVVSNVNVYPNPASESTKITFSSLENSNYKVALIDLTGREILTQNGTATEGSNELNLDLSKVSKGAYMISLVNGDHASQIRLIVD